MSVLPPHHEFKLKAESQVAGLPHGEKRDRKLRFKRKLLYYRWRIREISRKVLGWVIIGFGFVFLAVGSVFALLPGHIGLPVMIIGLIMVLKNAFWARRQFIILKKKHPNWVMPLRKLLRRNPQVAPVVWHQLLRSERFLTKLTRLPRLLSIWRRKLNRKKIHNAT